MFENLVNLLNNDQRQKLDFIQEYSCNLWSKNTIYHPFFTLHGQKHSQSVVNILNQILDKKYYKSLRQNLTDEQIFYLLASVWLHDVGMVTNLSDTELLKIRENKFSQEDYIRDEHHNRSRDYIKTHYAELKLKIEEAHYISEIAVAHRKIDLLKIPENYPNIRFLGALLRLADEFDITSIRAPKELFEIEWQRMDELSRWHWLKHLCVKNSKPSYAYIIDEKPNLLSICFNYLITFPHKKYENIFWEKIKKPLKQVILDEHVDIILRLKQISIDIGKFSYSAIYSNENINELNISQCFEHYFNSEKKISDNLILKLKNIKEKNVVIYNLLEYQVEQLKNSCPESLNFIIIENMIIAFLSNVYYADSVSSVISARDNFRKNLDNWFYDSVTKEVEKKYLQEIFVFSEVSMRLFQFQIGDNSNKIISLQMLIHMQIDFLAPFFVEIIMNSDIPNLKKIAISGLAKVSSSAYLDVFITATKDPDPTIRLEALKSLKNNFGKNVYERLGQILETDVDGEVRRYATSILYYLTQPEISNRLLNINILIIDNETYFVPSLVDRIEKEGGKTKVIVDINQIENVFNEFIPKIIICSLEDVRNFNDQIDNVIDNLPGFGIIKFIREKFSSTIPIIATTSFLESDSFLNFLIKFNCVYVTKSNAIEVFIKTIECLILE